MITSRDPNELLPRTRIKYYAFSGGCKQVGIDVILTATYRDHASQNALYAKGRTEPGKIITHARGGDSYHNWRVAFDFVPIVGGKAVWDDLKLWAQCGLIAIDAGLEWGGTWTRFVDRPHCQDTGGFSIADYKAGRAQ